MFNVKPWKTISEEKMEVWCESCKTNHKVIKRVIYELDDLYELDSPEDIEIKDGKNVVTYEDGTVKTFPLIILKRKEAIQKLVEHGIEADEESCNYEIEDALNRNLGMGHVIDEWCPFDGMYCSWSSLHKKEFEKRRV